MTIPGEQGTEKKKRSFWLIGCFSALLLVGILVGSCFLFFQYGKTLIVPVAEHYAQLLTSGQFEQAYQLVTQESKLDQSLAEFISFHQAHLEKLGEYQRGNVSGVQVNKTSQGTFARIGYRAHFESGSTRIVITLKKVNKSWLVSETRYDSPPSTEQFRCTRCGNPYQVPANFCSQCGAALK